MTKATRWGVSALMVIGGLSLGAFAGCSDDDKTENPPPEEDTGTPQDTAKPDTATDTGGGTDTAVGDADTGTPGPDRAVTLVFAAPDMGPKVVCLGAFLATDDPAMKDKPLTTQPTAGALGIPDSAAPTDPTKTTPFPYGAVVPVPLNEAAITALDTFKVVLYLLDANPASLSPAKTCSDQWATVKGDTKKWSAFAPGTVKKGDHGILAMQGCLGGPSADGSGACGSAGNNFKFTVHKAAMTKPTEAGANLGVQFLHLSQFAGFALPGLDGGTTPVPGFQNVDVFIKPGPADADAGAPALIPVATNVKYDDAITGLHGVTLPAGIKNDQSFLVIAPRVIPADGGTTSAACSNSTPAPTPTCPNWTLPLAPFFAATTGYQRVGGGLEFPNTNQVIVISGSPIAPLTDGGMGAPTLRIPFARAAAWPM